MFTRDELTLFLGFMGIKIMDIADVAEKFINDDIERRTNSRIRYEGESARDCADCGDEIEEARRTAVPGVTLCRDCAAFAEELAKRKR